MAQELALGPLFTSHMVLQRDKAVRIFGTAQPGREIAVRLDATLYTTTAQECGWQVMLPPHEAGGPHTLTINDGSTALVLEDVLFGEVWFAGGQSNMEMGLLESLDGEAVLAACADDSLRLYTVPKYAWLNEAQQAAEQAAVWRPCGPSTAGEFSAVAYYCASALRRQLGVPVGVIGCYWGGTSISCWIDEKALARTKAGQRYIDDYAALVGQKSDSQYEAEMEAYFRAWNAWNGRVEVRRKREPDVTWEVLNAECGLCPWPQPAGRKSPFRPGGLNGSMVQRVAPYTLRGFLYYQGEEDAGRSSDYGEMLCCLAAHWRGLWGDTSLPFYIVQLPMYVAKQAYESGMKDDAWCTLRDGQQWAASMLANAGMAVALDLGEFDNIHPANKRPVGERLALQALAKAYGFPVQADGPRPVFAWADGDGGLLVRFTSGGLALRGDGGFALAGADGCWHAAAAEAAGEDTLRLTSARVWHPCAASYGWVPFGPAPLYNASGLPAAPFRIHI